MIRIKSPEQIEQMKPAGALSARALRMVGDIIRPGISTFELDEFAERIIRMGGGTPAFKGYGGFPGSICASVNEIVVHGIPSHDVVLQDGDIISIDTGAIVDGWVGDNAWTYMVGESVPARTKELLQVTEASLEAGIAQAVPGNHLGDIGAAVQKVAEDAGFGVIRQYVGHGIGRNMHEKPDVPNFGRRGTGVKLREGMVLAIEPMLTEGRYEVATRKDGWAVATLDGKSSAHFEKTVAITADGPVILTQE